MVLSEIPRSDLSESPLFKLYHLIFYLYKSIFWWKNDLKESFVAVIFKLLQKYSDFVNSDDCIRKISSIFIRNNLIFFETAIFGPIKFTFNVKTLNLC